MKRIYRYFTIVFLIFLVGGFALGQITDVSTLQQTAENSGDGMAASAIKGISVFWAIQGLPMSLLAISS